MGNTKDLDICLIVFTSAEEAWPYLQSNRPILIIVSPKNYAQEKMVAKDLNILKFIPEPMSMQTITDNVVKYTKAKLKSGNK